MTIRERVIDLGLGPADVARLLTLRLVTAEDVLDDG